jgi:nucleoside-diphosphate-sugar epimerase
VRVFVAGASGVLGARLVPQLIARGHEVIGTYRSHAKADVLRSLGAQAVPLDLLDPTSVTRAVLAAHPDAVIHQATALAGKSFAGSLDSVFAETNRLRTVGTDALLAAARSTGVRRIVAQSFAPYRYVPQGGMVKGEEDPVDGRGSKGTEVTFAAMAHLDRVVTEAGGIALRYGGFYGDADNALVVAVRKRMYPVVGSGAGVMSFVHLEDAASATALALENGRPGIYNVVDDEPAPLRDWLPALAEVLHAKPPRHVPAWLARLVAGRAAVEMAMATRGASNAKAKRELGWRLRFPSWRQGFPAAYG